MGERAPGEMHARVRTDAVSNNRRAFAGRQQQQHAARRGSKEAARPTLARAGGGSEELMRRNLRRGRSDSPSSLSDWTASSRGARLNSCTSSVHSCMEEWSDTVGLSSEVAMAAMVSPQQARALAVSSLEGSCDEENQISFIKRGEVRVCGGEGGGGWAASPRPATLPQLRQRPPPLWDPAAANACVFCRQRRELQSTPARWQRDTPSLGTRPR